MKKLIYISLLAILSTSCGHYRWVVKNKDKLCLELCNQVQLDTMPLTVIHDTVIDSSYYEVIKPDTGILRLYIRCDSLNNVLITELGNSGKVIIQYKYIDKILKVQASTEEKRIFHSKLTKIKSQIQTITKYVTQYVPKPEKYIPFWIWLIIGAMGMIIIYLTFKKI